MHNAGQHKGQPFVQPRPEKAIPLMMMSSTTKGTITIFI